MALPPSLFEELEDVTVMLMTKRDRVGRNFSYSIGDPDQNVVYTVVEEELSTRFFDERRLPLKLRIMYQDEEVMRMDRLPAQTTCLNLCPYSKVFQVCSPAENIIGHIKRLSGYYVLDENKATIFTVIKNRDNLFGPTPKSVKRVSNQEIVAHIGRRWMMEPLGDIRPTPLQRWGARFLVPLSLKEKVLILAMTLFVDYMELSIDPAGHNSMVGRAKPNTPPMPR